MITISFIYPTALWLLFLLLPMVGIALLGPRRPTPRRFWSGLILRTILLLCVILALAGIQLNLPTNTLTTVFLLDVSDSIPAAEQARGENVIRQAVAAMPRGDSAAIVLFGQDALVERLASADERLADLTSTPVTARTDIASALQLGLALFPDEGAKRLVILSDGQENIGQALAQADLAAAHNIEISYVSLQGPQGDTEVLVDALNAPANAREGQAFDLAVTVRSTKQVNATLRLFGDGSLLRSEAVRLQTGVNRFQMPVDAVDGGFHRFRAQVVPDTDTWLQNNEASAFTVVHGPPRVLLVEGATAEAQNLATALQSAQMRVDTRPPSELPVALAELATFDAVILANVPAAALPAGGMAALQVYVRDLGKGLLMTGGENAFGAGGYLRTPLEETLPVDMDVRNKEQTPNLALALVVDKSGSMGACHCDDPNGQERFLRPESGQPKVDIAKEAVMQAAGALGPQDQLGVVAFDDTAHWSVAVNQLVDFVSLEQSIGGIQAAGDTNVEAGVVAAYDELQQANARRKHVILLTDGWGQEGKLTTLAQQMRDQGITLSVVAAGGGSAPYLETLAQSGGGRFYAAADILTVPDFFLKETVKAVGKYIVEEPFYPLPLASSPVLRNVNLELLPALWGYNGTTAKSTARTVLSTPKGDPLLATWQYGLGRAATWASDVKGRWATEWVAWDGFARFAAQLVGWTLAAPQIEGLSAQTFIEDGAAVIRVEAVDEVGQPRNFLDISATLIAPDLQTSDLSLAQVGAGLYEARMPVTQAGTFLVQLGVKEANASAASQPISQQTLGLVVPYSPEYRTRDTNRLLLAELAERTGGTELPEPVAAFLHNLPSAQRAREIWYPLLLLVALLFPLDIALRRVLFGTQPLQTAGAWLQERMPLRAKQSAQGEPVLGHLASARQRAQARQIRGESAPSAATSTAPTPEAPHQPAASDQPAQPSAPAASPASVDKALSPDEVSSLDEVSSEQDMLARLRKAKGRARHN